MKPLARSCLRWTIVYVIVGGALSALVYQRFPRPGIALACGFGAGLLVWFSVGYIAGIRTRRGEGQMMRRAMSGERPSDGEKIAVVGTIASSFETLEAPISKRSCVAYEYKGIPPTSEGEFAIIEGFALTPFSIDGPRGAIRILAVPELQSDFQVFSRLEHYANFREYVEKTTFTQRSGVNLKREIAHLKTVLADDDGRIRYDIQRDANIDIDHLQLKENVFAPGDRVAAIGRYSAAKNALVPDEEAMLHSVKITKGDAPAIAKRGRGQDLLEGCLGCGCLLPVIAAAIIGLAAVSLDQIEQQFVQKDPSWTEVKVERWVRREVRPRLKSILDDEGEFAILLEAGQARGKVLIGGTTHRLTRARARREDDAVEVTLSTDSGEPSVVARVRDGKLVSLGPAQFADAELETWSADENGCNGRITALSPGDGPKLRVMFRARIEHAP